MRRLYPFLFFFIGILFSQSTNSLFAQKAFYKGYPIVPNELIVKFKNNQQIKAGLNKIRNDHQKPGELQKIPIFGITSIDRLYQNFNIQKIEPLIRNAKELVQIGNLLANSEVPVSTSVVFDVGVDTPDGEQGWLFFDFVDNSGKA